MSRAIKYHDLSRMVSTIGVEAACSHLATAMEKKELRPEDFSIRELAETLVPDGREWVRNMDPTRKSGRFIVSEAGAVHTGLFSNITGQIVYNRLMESYKQPGLIGDLLVDTTPTTLQDGERIAGIGAIGDTAGVVKERDPYPLVGLSEDWIDTPVTTKRGHILAITREMIIADRTGVLLREAARVGDMLGINREKRILSVVLGITNNYKWRGTTYNTYQASTPWINTASNTLTDFTDIENAELKFDAMTDPNTGEPISIMVDTIIVPTALKKTLNNIIKSTEFRYATSSAAFTAVGPNPIEASYRVLSNPFVKSITSSAAKWYIGQPRKAFTYMEVWPITVVQAADNSEPEFTQDIVARYKASEKGVCAVIDPRYMVENT